jgi:hypothetical protein
MKNTLFIFVLACLSCSGLNAGVNKIKRDKTDSLACLRIEGIIRSAGEQGEYLVELVRPDAGIDSIYLKEGKKKFHFVLNKNTSYAIRISRKGYLSKVVSINTDLLTEQAGLHVFEFETSLMKEAAISRLNKDVLDFPVAIIHFDYVLNSFSYNKEYSANIRRELFKTGPIIPVSLPDETMASLSR